LCNHDLLYQSGNDKNIGDWLFFLSDLMTILCRRCPTSGRHMKKKILQTFLWNKRIPLAVIPAKAGIQRFQCVLDPPVIRLKYRRTEDDKIRLYGQTLHSI